MKRVKASEGENFSLSGARDRVLFFVSAGVVVVAPIVGLSFSAWQASTTFGLGFFQTLPGLYRLMLYLMNDLHSGDAAALGGLLAPAIVGVGLGVMATVSALLFGLAWLRSSERSDR